MGKCRHNLHGFVPRNAPGIMLADSFITPSIPASIIIIT